MKKFLAFAIIVCFMQNAINGQVPLPVPQVVHDPINNAVLAASKAISEATNKLSRKQALTMEDVKNSSQELLKLSKDYQESLAKVKTVISSGKAVNDCFNSYKQIIINYSNNYGYVSSLLRGDTLILFQNTMNGALSKSVAELKNLNMFIKPNFYSMTDGERIQRIDDVAKNLSYYNKILNDFIMVYKTFGERNRTNRPSSNRLRY